MKRNRIVIGIIILAFFTLGSKKLTAQEQADGQWTIYTTANGLPYNEVGAITFGPDGDLWCVLVTPGGGGVAHFDGNTWEHYTNEDGLGSDAILWFENALAVSSDGVLWVATFDGGVSRFDGEAWTSYTTEDGLLSDMVAAVAIAPDSDLWCNHPGPDLGISHFDGDSCTILAPGDIGETFHIMNIAFDPDSALWAIGSHVLRYHNESWTNFSTQAGMEIALYMDIGPDGKIWIGGDGVTCYEDGSWTHYSLADIGAKGKGELLPLAVDSENVLWLGISDDIDENNEVFRFDGQSWTKFVPEGGPDLKNIYSIEVGPDSSIWFGTDYGIFRYKEKAPLTNLPYINENKLAVYPNPVRDVIHINTGNNYEQMTDYTIKIINTTGIVIFESRVNGPLLNIDVSDSDETGLHLLQLIDNTSQRVDIRKIILE